MSSFTIYARDGNLKELKLLIKNNYQIKDVDIESLTQASMHGQLETLKYLIETLEMDPTHDNDAAIEWAAYYNQLNTVEYLSTLPDVDIEEALIWAINKNHKVIVKFFIESNHDITFNNCNAVIRIWQHAKYDDNNDNLKLAISDATVRKKLNEIKGMNIKHFKKLWEEIVTSKIELTKTKKILYTLINVDIGDLIISFI